MTSILSSRVRPLTLILLPTLWHLGLSILNFEWVPNTENDEEKNKEEEEEEKKK